MGLRESIKVVSFLCLVNLASSTLRLQEQFSWNALDYNFPDEAVRQSFLLSRAFIPENNLPLGIERWNDKIFITVPRWKQGIPATLNYIQLDKNVGTSPRLNPYPNLESNELGNCENGLNTVYRVKADKCDRLWVLDTGTFGYGNTTINPCPYALNVIDLKTDTRIRRYELRPEDTDEASLIANIAVDVGTSCDDTFAYLSDELGYGLISYSWEQNKSWRFSHSFFLPDPLLGDFNIAGLNFQMEDGIVGMALSPVRDDGFRDLYFSPLVSHREFVVSTEVLRNETAVDASFHEFKYLDERGPNSHTTAQVMDEHGILLFNLVDQNAIGCWNSELPHLPQNQAVVDKDDVALVYQSDIKIDDYNNVWVLSNRMPVFLEAELNYNDVNFRIFTSPLQSLIAGSVCDQNKKFLNNRPNPFEQQFHDPFFGNDLVFDNHLQPSLIQNSPVLPTQIYKPNRFPFDARPNKILSRFNNNYNHMRYPGSGKHARLPFQSPRNPFLNHGFNNNFIQRSFNKNQGPWIPTSSIQHKIGQWH